MTNIATLKVDLASWLESLPGHQVVGVRNDPNGCVLSNFLTATGCVPVTVRKGMAGDLRLPAWACTFYNLMDMSCRRKTGEYTAATALTALATLAKV